MGNAGKTAVTSASSLANLVPWFSEISRYSP